MLPTDPPTHPPTHRVKRRKGQFLHYYWTIDPVSSVLCKIRAPDICIAILEIYERLADDLAIYNFERQAHYAVYEQLETSGLRRDRLSARDGRDGDFSTFGSVCECERDLPFELYTMRSRTEYRVFAKVWSVVPRIFVAVI